MLSTYRIHYRTRYGQRGVISKLYDTFGGAQDMADALETHGGRIRYWVQTWRTDLRMLATGWVQRATRKAA